MGLIPAGEQDRLNLAKSWLDRTVPKGRAPSDTDSTTAVPYLPTEAEAVRHRTEQPAIGYTPDAADAAQRQAVADYEKQVQR